MLLLYYIFVCFHIAQDLKRSSFCIVTSQNIVERLGLYHPD